MSPAVRSLGWTTLAAALALLGGSAIAKPMSDADYKTRVQIEVDFQNMTCPDIDYLWHVFDDMVTRCRPVGSEVGTYLPPRTCHELGGGPAPPKPTYRLSPDMYSTLGPTQRAYLAAAGIPWDVDADQAELHGPPSTTQFYVPAPINALAAELEIAARLKNCRQL